MRFRLQKLLDLASKEEELLKNELFRIRQEKSAIFENIEKTQQYIYKIKEEISSAETTGQELQFKIAIISQGENYLNSLWNKFYEMEKKEQEILDEYLEKRKQRLSLEKLKERKTMEYVTELNRKEIRIIDEIAEKKFFRERGEGTNGYI
ncbi:flagellar FliJ family protein [Thermosipho ferrireducens]|uniref:Flagellar FliJ protein n=1 Tax=Thermosipho ferrireducens TaxID=2571116 RepID=A0ABX7S7N2_9BACT|nr:flagellar FliJ family protein [Thermosipho ferrireducens]QTA38604.1 flagellar FliJ family protein [Thermosipho ferrireducens]